MPIQMAGAFATVANKGVFCEPRVIDKVVSTEGKELPVPKQSCTKVLEPEVAATAAHALRGVMNATGSAARLGDGVPVIGKTGTNESYGTAMATATTQTATFIFSGFDRDMNSDSIPWNERKTLERTYGPSGMQLSQIRFPLSRAMQGAANAAYGGDQFPSPDRSLTRTVLRDLPDVVGKSIDEARGILQGAGFSVAIGDPIDSEIGQGLVAAQSPGAGRAPSGATITLSPSSGKKPEAEKPESTVPNVTGAKYNQAKAALEKLGFGVSEDGCKGGSTVSAQDPAAETKAPAGTEVPVPPIVRERIA